jgi:hypothetical protein
MSDVDAQNIGLPTGDQQFLVQTWYAAALYCLEKSEFMRHNHIHTVQTVAILGICCNNLGDSNVFSNLLVCATKIAHRLGMNGGLTEPIMGLPQHWCNRLWWTLLICEW